MRRDSGQTTYRDMFAGYAKEDKRRQKPRLIAVLRGAIPETEVWFVMHGACGMQTPDTKMPNGKLWDAIPVESLNADLKHKAAHEICALGPDCPWYLGEENMSRKTYNLIESILGYDPVKYKFID